MPWEILIRFAPVFFQEASIQTEKMRWDFPVAADFDGDSAGANNEESLRLGKHPLVAAVYGAFLETPTHYFLTYSLFHPLDWSPWPAWIPYTWHENDMESVQVVVRKSEGGRTGPEIVACQAHFGTRITRISPDQALLLDSNLALGGTHVAVRVEKGGHGLHPLAAKPAGRHMVFRPAPAVADTFRPEPAIFRYRILSTEDAFWKPYLRGHGIGDGKLMDGRFDYRGERISWSGLPRHFDSDRLSGPWKRDSGILPFAFSTRLDADDLGALFFDPARKYLDLGEAMTPWSIEYVRNPFWPHPPF